MRLRFTALILSLTLALLAVPLPVEAQTAGKVWRIGLLLPHSPSPADSLKALLQGLQELGYEEGRNVTFEYRWAKGRYDRLPALAAELVRPEVDVILALGTPATRAAGQATTTIPIVMVHVADPVGSRFVASLARPGGNITGVSSRREGFGGKWLELVTETVPTASRVAALWNPDNPGNVVIFKEMQLAARVLGIEVQSLEVRASDHFEGAFAALVRGRAGALIVVPSGFMAANRKRILEFVAKNRVPAIYPYRVFMKEGGLMMYGPSVRDSYRRAATYVDKLLKGAKPADLPVEQPTKFDLWINLKTAKALGLTIPPSVLIRADKVIE